MPSRRSRRTGSSTTAISLSTTSPPSSAASPSRSSACPERDPRRRPRRGPRCAPPRPSRRRGSRASRRPEHLRRSGLCPRRAEAEGRSIGEERASPATGGGRRPEHWRGAGFARDGRRPKAGALERSGLRPRRAEAEGRSIGEKMKQTHKSLLTTLAFVVVAGAIAGAAFWVKTDVSKEETRKEKAAKVFDGLDKSKVRELRVSKEGKLFAAASRPDDKTSWKLTEPVQADADGTVIDAMVSAIGDLKQKTEIGDGDAKQYGFDPPRIAATVKLDDGKEQSLEVGETNPFDNTIYVRKGGEKTIRVADGWAKSSFEKTLVDLRDKRVAH